MHRFNPRAIRVYLVQSSLLLRFIVSLLTYAHLALFVGEPSYSRDSGPSDDLPGLLAVESAIILVYVIDTAMLAYHMGVRDLLASWWNVIFLFVAAAMVVDVSGTWAAWGVARFSRPMRPFMVAFHNQHLRRVVQSIVASLPSVAEMMLFTVFVTFIYAAVAVQLLQVRRGSAAVCIPVCACVRACCLRDIALISAVERVLRVARVCGVCANSFLLMPSAGCVCAG
jgi:hypothetical protein